MAMRVAERTWEVLWANWINVRGVMKRVLEDLFWAYWPRHPSVKDGEASRPRKD
jgi:hypothetical protein